MNRRAYLKKATILLGGILSGPTLMAMKQWENPRKSNMSFTISESEIVEEIAEMIIPRTTTPGAIDAKVPAFITMMIADCYKKPEQESFKKGIATLSSEGFMKLAKTEKVNKLKMLELASNLEMDARNVKKTKIGDNIDQESIEESAVGLPFWRLIKELTLLGYYTSEEGIMSNFEYVQIPGKFEPIKMKEGQKSFAY